jgi:DNA-binding GntR family transcriptional regulator
MPPIERLSLHDELLGQLRKMISDGSLPIGGKIPERELCEKFGVSRTPLREAIKVLAAEGLVRLEPHRGAIVNELSPEELEEILPIVSALEGLSGELACEHVTDEDIAAIRESNDKMMEAFAAGNSKNFIKWHQEFHGRILAATRNPLLIAIYDSTCSRVGRARVCVRLPREAVDHAMEEHAGIMAALEARQGPKLAALLRRHIEVALGSYRKTMKSHGKR